MKKRIHGLDLLRSLAIGLVMLGHAGQIMQLKFPGVTPFVNTGPFGVDLFFVLSGFLIGGILLRLRDDLAGPRTLAGFWLSRALRTLPSYYLFVGVNVAVRLLVYRYPLQSWRAVLPYLVFGQSLFRRPDWFFVESWSLCVEEWFYFLLPVAICLCLQVLRRMVPVYCALVGAMIAASLCLRAAVRPGDLDSLAVVYHADSIGLGLAAAAVAAARPVAWRRAAPAAAWAGAVLAGLAYAYAVRPHDEASLLACAAAPFARALGYALLLPWASGRLAGGGSPFEAATAAVARWSYSLYLTNFICCITSMIFVMPRLGITAAVAAMLASSLLASAALYRWFEKPVLELRGRIPVCRETRAYVPFAPDPAPAAAAPARGS